MNQNLEFNANVFKKQVEIYSSKSGWNNTNVKRKILERSGCDYIKDFDSYIEIKDASDGAIVRYFGFLYQRICAD